MQPPLRIERLLSAEQLASRVAELGRQITDDYAGSELTVIGVLKGCWVFMADLVRQIGLPLHCDFVRLSSYGGATVSSGRPELLMDTSASLGGRHVLLLDDLIDTGLSTAWLVEHLGRQGPASLRVCVLLDKPARRRVSVRVDYVGFEIPDRFVVGYGVDYAERYRELPYVGMLIDEPSA